jgi:hypothetical protein
VYESLDDESLFHIVVSVPRAQPGTGGKTVTHTHGHKQA